MKSRITNIILPAIVVVFSFATKAQNKLLDSLRTVLQTKQKDTARINSLNELSYGWYMAAEYDSAMKYGQEALEFAKRIKYEKGEGYALLYIGCNYADRGKPVTADSLYDLSAIIAHRINDKRLIGLVYHTMGGTAWYAGNYPDAFKYYDSALLYYRGVGDKRLIALIMRVYGIMYNNLGNFPEAIQHTYAALKYFEEIGDESMIAECYSFNGDINKEHNLYDDALKDYTLALNIYERTYGKPGTPDVNKYMIPFTLCSIGELYLLQKKPAAALEKFSIASKKIEALANQKLYGGTQSLCIAGIGSVYELWGDTASESADIKTAQINFYKAKDFYTQSLDIAEKAGFDFQKAKTFVLLGNIYVKLGDYSKADSWLNQGLRISSGNQYKTIERDAYLYLFRLYELTGNISKAHDHYKKYILHRDSIVNEESIRKTEGFKLQSEFDRKEAIAKAEQQKRDAEVKRTRKIQYLAIAALAILVLAVVVIAMIQWRNNAHKQKANLLLQQQKEKIESTLTDLKATQTQLIQSEKMASLGELTAGIAHEIQNPLNFVNNFSGVSSELIDEMNSEIEKGNFVEAQLIAADLKQNLDKINHHGQRAGDIVKSMLQHSRSSSATKELTDINKLADEYFRLAYHGLRAKDKSFNASMKTNFDETVGNINIIPQDIGRVILNLIINAFYVVNEKKIQQPAGYEPTVSLSTKKEGDRILITVKDNGNGISQKVLDKIFQPFFTTKPTGQGTGLGLSLSYDIVKAHGGELKVETKEGEGTLFTIKLPAGN